MAKLTVVYPTFRGPLTPISYLEAGEIFEWENDFWIMTDEKFFVSLTRGGVICLEGLPDDELVTLLNDARLFPYGDYQEVNTMKKFAVLVLAVMMLLSLCACGASEAGSDESALQAGFSTDLAHGLEGATGSMPK